jgi:ABC-type sugar transport system substrate-binding protein
MAHARLRDLVDQFQTGHLDRRQFFLRALALGLSASAAGTLLRQAELVSAQETHKVAVIPPALTSPFHRAVEEGAREAAEGLGWEIQTQAPDREDNYQQQVDIVNALLQTDVQAISVNPINAQAIVSAVVNANEAGIPILMHNMLTPVGAAEGAEVVEYIGYDQWSAGEKAGHYAADLLGGEGKVYILNGLDGFHTHRRVGGFKAALSEYPGIEIAGEQFADWLREKGQQVATAALQADPDIKLFFGASDEMAIGAANAARDQGLDVFTIGIDGNDVTLDLIEKGEVTATVGVYPKRMGEVVIQQMEKMFAGEEIPAFLWTPSIVVDADNLEAYQSGDTWEEPTAGAGEEDTGEPTIAEDAATPTA